ncbi:MAG: ABC transporter permease [Verrucomicrobiales bacterium]|nr:ABC transporter permease [Verrucomicrobiales bacterium]
MTRREASGAGSLWALNQAPLLLFATVVVGFGLLSPAFLRPVNAMNILIQASSTGILAVGMTFVLLTAGVDLSVGSIMFVAAAVGGKLALGGFPVAGVIAAMAAIGMVYGALNAVFITRFAVLAFVVTLATRYFGRGLGLRITETRAMNLPEAFYTLGATKFIGLPLPVLIFVVVAVGAHLVLTRTPFGRHVYAIGADADAARKAGIETRSVLFAVYGICGILAAISAVVALSQAPAVSPGFGNNREFLAIAAAVLGGTSLFGGRGAVLPGTVLGAVLIQTLENGLTILNVNAYLYPLITSAVIFLAVLLDATRSRILARVNRRRIYVETGRISELPTG